MSVTFAQGFSAAGVAAGISSVEGKKDLALVVNNGPLDAAAGVFTSNRFCAAPVQWSRKVVADGHVKAVILNSGGANACTGEEGLDNCRKMLLLAKAGKYNGYLLEGMGCPGGCIGGAGTIADPVRTAAVLNKYVKDAEFTDPEQSAFMSNIHMLKDDPNFEV